MVERTLAAQTKKSTAPDNRIRIGVMQANGDVLVQGSVISAGWLNGPTVDAGASVAIVRQDKTWLVLGQVMPDFQQAIHTQAGFANVTVSAATSATLIITFDRPFSQTPVVTTTINSGAGSTASWQSRAINIVPNGFTIFIFGPSSSFTASVGWMAQAVTQ